MGEKVVKNSLVNNTFLLNISKLRLYLHSEWLVFVIVVHINSYSIISQPDMSGFPSL